MAVSMNFKGEKPTVSVTYTRRRKLNQRGINIFLANICDELALFNEDVSFAISKNFIEHPKSGRWIPYSGDKYLEQVIIISVPIDKLILPTVYRIVEDGNNLYLTHFYEKSFRIKLIYKKIEITDGCINERPIERFNLRFIDDEQMSKKISI